MSLRIARIAVAIACLATFLPSQQEGGDVRNAEEMAEMIRRKKAASGESVDGADGSKREMEDEKNLTPEERLARHITHGASQYCRFHISVHPAKLLPGQSGTVKVVAALAGKAVLPAPAPFEVVGPAQQGMITLGAFALQPAQAGRLASAYLGRPVYDNFAVVEIPVTMSPAAAMGSKHVVAVEMKLDLYDGSSAQPIGRFLDRVATDVEVGTVADPAVKGGSKPAVVAKEPTPSGAVRPAQPPSPAPLEANAVTPTPAPAAAAPAAAGAGGDAPLDSLPMDEGSGSLPLPVWIAGGVVALALVLLLARRK